MQNIKKLFKQKISKIIYIFHYLVKTKYLLISYSNYIIHKNNTNTIQLNNLQYIF